MKYFFTTPKSLPDFERMPCLVFINASSMGRMARKIFKTRPVSMTTNSQIPQLML